ncbi:MAG: peptidase, partial [Pseudomonadota bacterium]
MKKTTLISVSSILFLTACGGGGSSDNAAALPPEPILVSPIPAPTEWEEGVFELASAFKDRCEVVRAQPDINGVAYPDVEGTQFDEKMWLRSWTHETYLWYDEVIDRDPETFSSVLDYFDVLVTNETTASGAAKDNFHFF